MVVLAGLVTTGSPARATGATGIDRVTVARNINSVTMKRSCLKGARMSKQRAKGTAAERAVADDIVTRLRELAIGGLYGINIAPFEHYNAAADEIERLRTELNLARRAYDMEIFGESDIDENGVVRGE